MASYAQNGEDTLAASIFDRIGVERPSYLDIGAYHPFELSHTALFYLRGSRGINVEVDPVLIREFNRSRPDDVNICAAVGPKAGRATFNLDHHSLMQFELGETMEVDVMTVDEILDEHMGTFPDFLTTDIEGMDLAVLESIDYARRAPKVICAEVGTDASGKYVDVSEQLCRSLKRHGFSPYRRIDNNQFFVAEEFLGKL